MVETSVEARNWLINRLQEGGQDVLRGLAEAMIHALMNSEADAMCGARYGERSPDRVNHRNGYRERQLDTRLGTLELQVPKLREGSYFPGWILEPRRRIEKALVAVVAECYVAGVSTRKVEQVVQTLGIEGISKSQVSEMARSLDAQVEAFRNRPLDTGPYRYVWLDALVVRCRELGRIVNVAVVVGTGINKEGSKEVLGVDVITSEDGAGWAAFLRTLVGRGLSGVELVISDAHVGLKQAIAAVLPGASWQRCRTHFVRNLLAKIPKRAQQPVAALVRSIFAQTTAAEVHEQHRVVVEKLHGQFRDAALLLEQAGPELLAFAAFPEKHWRQVWSNNPQERVNREIRRRTDVVGIFPNRDAILRLVTAVLNEQHDEWAVGRRHMSLESLAELNARREAVGDAPALPKAA